MADAKVMAHPATVQQIRAEIADLLELERNNLIRQHERELLALLLKKYGQPSGAAH